MARDIKQAAVIGAGVMGSGIAAHIANAGVPVLLLDIPQKGFGKKDTLAEGALERMQKAEPAPFMSKEAAKRVTPGNIEDDLKKLKECDWVVEAVVEKLDVKQDLYEKLEKVIRPDTIVSSNTSTIPLHALTEGRSAAFRKNFLITHFFNPPRYMRLLELVKGPETDPEILKTLHDFCDVRLGKGVVFCHDTPGFIGNRIGTFWLQAAVLEAIDQGMTVEEADALFSKPMGIPKTGVFGLIDLVGLDLMPLIGKSMTASLPKEDSYCQIYREPELIRKMIADGYTGRKGKGGFYRINKKEDGTKVKESIDLKTGEYAPSRKPRLASIEAARSGLRFLLEYQDKTGTYAWKVLSMTLAYTASLIPEIADDIVAVDTAMKLGYGWKYGPFELLDQLGPKWFADRLMAEGRQVPDILSKVGNGSFYRVENGTLHYFTLKGTYESLPRRPGQLLLSDIKLKSQPLAKNASAKLWDLGDGVICLEFTSKMNALDLEIMKMIRKAIELIESADLYKALVIHNEETNFSVGANLGLALFAANAALWQQIEELVAEGQQTYKALKYANFPVVAAPSGMALGGGCEILLHCDAVQAHAESYVGLVEVGVGLIPAWGGCKEMITRWLNNNKRPGGSMVALAKVFEMIGTAKVAKSAFEAKEMLFFREGDSITMNRDRLLADAKAKALSMVASYKPPVEQEVQLPGGVAKVAMLMAVKGFVKAGKATPYDEEISKKLADVLSGGDTDISDKVDENTILDLERAAFMTLIRDERTLARMEHILETGKPLRN